MQQGKVVENKRLSATADFLEERQRERIPAEVAKPSMNLRKGVCCAREGIEGERGQDDARYRRPGVHAV